MSVTISGSGTITGISAGGFPDGSITNDDLAGSITDAKLSGTTCKAWVNFDGTGTPAARASFNVSSITDNGTGDYTVNFTTALADANYAALVSTSPTPDNFKMVSSPFNNAGIVATPTSSDFKLNTFSRTDGASKDATYVCIAVFR